MNNKLVLLNKKEKRDKMIEIKSFHLKNIINTLNFEFRIFSVYLLFPRRKNLWFETCKITLILEEF